VTSVRNCGNANGLLKGHTPVVIVIIELYDQPAKHYCHLYPLGKASLPGSAAASFMAAWF
jgi:hypothetical protein